MNEPQLTPRDLFIMLRTIDSRLIELTHIVQKLTQQGQEIMPQSQIMGPSREVARNEVAEYIKSMSDFRAQFLGGAYGNRLKLLKYALDVLKPQPDDIAVEFGVCGGESLSVISRMCPGKVYGFDSFEGLPQDENGWKKGQFSHSMQLDYQIGANAELVQGWFSDSLPPFVEKTDLSKIRFVHVDSDLYSSAKTIFDVLVSKLDHEVIIAFDEYWNFPDWKNAEFKAFQEFIAASGRTYEYLAFMDCGQQVAVRLHAKT